MELLRILTLVYVGVLVLALAASLIAIWVYLRRIAGALGEAKQALLRAERESAPLQGYIEPLRDGTGETADDLGAAKDALKEANEHLSALAERLGVGALAP